MIILKVLSISLVLESEIVPERMFQTGIFMHIFLCILPNKNVHAEVFLKKTILKSFSNSPENTYHGILFW